LYNMYRPSEIDFFINYKHEYRTFKYANCQFKRTSYRMCFMLIIYSI